MFMKIRAAFGLVALAVIGGSVANAATCRNEFTGELLNATVVGTDAGETFGPDASFTFTLRDNDIVQAGRGNDTVYVQGLAGLTICLSAGDDQVINGDRAGTQNGRGFSIRGGSGNDRVSGTPYNDAVNGGAGDRDEFNDWFSDDIDVCRNFESLRNCELVNPPDAPDAPE